MTRGQALQVDRERFAMTKGLIILYMQIDRNSHDIQRGVTGGQEKIRDTRTGITDGQ